MTVDDMIDDILAREGGDFVDHPADRGGPTKFGVTQKTLSIYLGRPAKVEDVRGIDRITAGIIFRSMYYQRPKIDRLPGSIQPFMFDASVHHGPSRAITMLQEVISDCRFGPIAIDGIVGPVTIRLSTVAEDAMGDWLIACLVEQRLMFFRTIVRRNPSQKVFHRGWRNRVVAFWPDRIDRSLIV